MNLVSVPLVSRDGTALGELLLSELPGRVGSIRDRHADPARHRAAAPIQLVEAATYRYEVRLAGEINSVEPSELIDADDGSWRTGRVRTREHVGEIELRVAVRDSSGAPIEALARVDVRTSKIEDEHAFHSMLSDLADFAVEALHQGFAPSAGHFGTAPQADPNLLFQQFAIVHARLFSPELDGALERVRSQPYESWERVAENRPPGTPVRGSSRLAASIAVPGPRRRPRTARGRLTSIPAQLPVERTDATFDNPPNRFVRFALERWLQLAHATASALERGVSGGPLQRGRRETNRVIVRLEELLAGPPLKDVGRLHTFPAGNQVLQKRDGYRQVFAAALLVEASVALEIDIDDPFTVSRKTVATLYEFWCFVRVAEALAKACGGRAATQLFEPTENGMSLRLRRDRTARAEFETTLFGQRVNAELFFNKNFSVGTEEGMSWTGRMRPDISIRVTADPAMLGAEHWIHFDAKYRLGPSMASGSASEDERRHQADDLLKMHAYRDGIRGSAAAYVLFPGGVPQTFEFGREPLPALGVWPLRPDVAQADGAALEGLFNRLLAHAVNGTTRHRRAEYWSRTAHLGPAGASSGGSPWEVERPPADVPVLAAYVRSPEQRAWIEEARIYNLRSGPRRGAVALGAAPLDATLLVLHGGASWQGPPVLVRRTSDWRAADRSALLQLGYRNPGGDAYLCCDVEPSEIQPTWLAPAIRALVALRGGLVGAPLASTWLELGSLGVSNDRLT